jgi:alpha-glucosidase
MFDTLRFWLARGVDGFRIDVLSLLVELVPPLEQTVAYYGANGGWPNWVLGNHDTPRVASRVGPAQARVAAMLLLTLPGTPILYQGDELGLADVPIPPGQERDPVARLLPGRGRDPERTPMPWDAGPGAGFTTGRPWLPLGEANRSRQVAAQREDPASMLTLHRRLLRLRRAAPALATDAYDPLDTGGDVLAYLRTGPGGDRYLVVLNLGPARHDALVDGELILAGDEGVVVELA